jgi:Rps23 Pro-64 3,4-dihydroxylase Tpa1-like proline 4-hydroxylase
MKINVFTHPFEHVIIENYFEDNELKDIFCELEAIFKFKEKTNSLHVWNKSARKQGSFLSNRIAFNISYFAKDKNSITEKHFEKLFSLKISEYLFKNTYFCNFLKCVNDTGVVVGVYQEGDYYKPHYDTGIITALSHIWYEDYKFEGGELYFPDYNNYTLTPKNNNLIIFPSHITHGVKDITSVSKHNDILHNRISLTLLTHSLPGLEANNNSKVKR